MKKFNVGVIGCGGRGTGWISGLLSDLEYVNIVAICDLYEDRMERAAGKLADKGFEKPEFFGDYKKLIDSDKVEVVLAFSAWSNHIDAALYAMEAGKPVGVEVGGAHTVEQCWNLVRTYERTKTPIMMLENCCFGEWELMTLNMVRHGLLGDIVHCTGAYAHDLRSEITKGYDNHPHYRQNEYLTRNTENYPTHEIGPIAKILNINNGNRFDSLVSVSSPAKGLKEYINADPELKEKFGDLTFRQSDIVNTLIKCADGTTVAIKLDTTLPRFYSREFSVRGTKGLYEEASQSVFIEGDDYGDSEWDWAPQFGNRKNYTEKWEHPIWKRYHNDGVKEGHGGMDFLVMDAFFEALANDLPMPVDVYDMATWMAISALSDKSLKTGSQVVEFPDFTEGKWQVHKEEPDWKYKM